MKYVDRIELDSSPFARTIELYMGDISSIGPEHSVGVLAVSAFPSDYTPSRGSVIGALSRKGISVAALAQEKAEDLRSAFGCWLSRDIQGVGFGRILCFEPRVRGKPNEVIGDFFRCVASLAGASFSIRSLAMPVFATGDQHYPVTVMLHAIVHAAMVWMKDDFPLHRLVIVSPENRVDEAAEVFRDVKAAAKPQEVGVEDVDIVLSAAPEDHCLADTTTEVIAAVAPEVRVYRSPASMTKVPGYERAHYSRLDSCRRVISLLTPAFIHSKACQEDLCIARFRAQQSLAPLLFPILLTREVLPPSLRVLRMVDCRDDVRSLRMVAAVLAIQVQGLRAANEKAADPAAELSLSSALAINSLARVLGSPVLGSARRFSDTGMPGSVSRGSLVLELCQSLFSAEEFKVEVRHLPGGEELISSLPSVGSAAPLVFFDSAVEAMSRRGMIDEHFFARLRVVRPLREADILQISQEWVLLGSQLGS